MTASNDYLGLSGDPRVRAAAANAVARYGTSCSGSRLICGTLPLHKELAARLVVDGAHDIGLLGAHGRGVAEHFGVPDAVDLYTGTLSKCFGSIGGLVAGPADVIAYLRYAARSVMFSASMPPASVAATPRGVSDYTPDQGGRRLSAPDDRQ